MINDDDRAVATYLLDIARHRFAEKLVAEPAQLASFKGLNQKAYETNSRRLLRRGFTHLSDVQIPAIDQAACNLMSPSVIRQFLAVDGSTLARYVQLRPASARVVRAAGAALRKRQAALAWSTLRMLRGRTTDLWSFVTGFTDGVLVVTTNDTDAQAFEEPPGIDRQIESANVDLADLARLHRDRIRRKVKQGNRSIRPLQMRLEADAVDLLARLQAARHLHRSQIGWYSERELAVLLGDEQRASRVKEQIGELLRHEEEADSPCAYALNSTEISVREAIEDTSASALAELEPPAPAWSEPARCAHYGTMLSHISARVGPIVGVFEDPSPDGVRIDVQVVAPGAGSLYPRLITVGMSAKPMSVPLGVDSPKHIELVMTLPPDWPLDEVSMRDPRWYWPVLWLQRLAAAPHRTGNWFGVWHTIPAGSGEHPIHEQSPMKGFMLAPACSMPDGSDVMNQPDAPRVQWLAVIALHEDEIALKLQAGPAELARRLAAQGLDDQLDMHRASIATATSGDDAPKANVDISAQTSLRLDLKGLVQRALDVGIEQARQYPEGFSPRVVGEDGYVHELTDALAGVSNLDPAAATRALLDGLWPDQSRCALVRCAIQTGPGGELWNVVVVRTFERDGPQEEVWAQRYSARRWWRPFRAEGLPRRLDDDGQSMDTIQLPVAVE